MLIGGLQKLSLLDFPGRPAAVIFTAGCNFCCGFCHNPELVKNQESPHQNKFGTGQAGIRNQEYSEDEVLSFLKSRRGLLEGVVITGGEPTIQPDLADFIKRVKESGFPIKLDTNGSNPIIIERLIKDSLVDFLAMDIKAPLQKYQDIVERAVDTELVRKSIEIIKNSGVDYEFRSTVISGIHSSEDVLNMARLARGAKKFVLQQFVSRDKLVDENFVGRKSFAQKELEELARQCEQWVERCGVR